MEGRSSVVVQACWPGHGGLTLRPPGSSRPGHCIPLVAETRCPPVPRLCRHRHGGAPGTTGGDLHSLTACRPRWCHCTSCVPQFHGGWWQVEGSLGALSAPPPPRPPSEGSQLRHCWPVSSGGPQLWGPDWPLQGKGRGGHGSARDCLASKGRPQLQETARSCAGLRVCDEV